MRTFLLVALGRSADEIDDAIAKTTLCSRYQIEPGKWLFRSHHVTTEQAANALLLPPLATFILVPIPYYYGRARAATWEWLATAGTGST